MRTNPFVTGVQTAAYPREALGLYAAQVYVVASQFPRVLSALLSACDEPEIRQSLLANLLEEEGAVAFAAGEGLRLDPARRHSALAKRFLDATGGNADAVQSDYEWLHNALRLGNWIEPLAFITVGQEANVPQTFSLLVPALRDMYGFLDEDLVFFTEHITADERHGADGAAMVAAAAQSRGLSEAAIRGARRGAEFWWASYARFDRRARAYGNA